jgi:hypothetical protein
MASFHNLKPEKGIRVFKFFGLKILVDYFR